jgi:hypothetical protein
MTLTAYYQGREVWRWEGPTWPPVELEPIANGWTYAVGHIGPLGKEALRLVVPRIGDHNRGNDEMH